MRVKVKAKAFISKYLLPSKHKEASLDVNMLASMPLQDFIAAIDEIDVLNDSGSKIESILLACEQSNGNDKLQYCFEHYRIKANAFDGNGVDLLSHFAHRGQHKAVSLSLEQLEATVVANSTGENALFYAVLGGHQKCVELLLNSKFNPDDCDARGRDLVFYALTANNPQILKLVLDSNKFNPTKMDVDGHTALDCAEYAGINSKCVDLLRTKITDDLNSAPPVYNDFADSEMIGVEALVEVEAV